MGNPHHMRRRDSLATERIESCLGLQICEYRRVDLAQELIVSEGHKPHTLDGLRRTDSRAASQSCGDACSHTATRLHDETQS
jgi:hypothetical protein